MTDNMVTSLMESHRKDKMNVFELFTKLNHPTEEMGWIKTTAVFTGRTERAAIGTPGQYKNADYLEYEIRYFVSGEERRGWYAFHPLDDPDPDEIKGSELQIRYNGKKPWLFEAIE